MRSGNTHETLIVLGEYSRPDFGLSFTGRVPNLDPSGKPGWQSNGGVERGAATRSLPFTLEIEIPDVRGRLLRAHAIGVFALYAGKRNESAGTLGAAFYLGDENHPSLRVDLINGRHYFDASNLEPMSRLIGDGASIETIGALKLNDQMVRVDMLSLDVPADAAKADFLKFKDLGSPASFILFDVFFEFEEVRGCPFGTHGGGIGLGELGAIVRVGDRVRFGKSLDQLERALLAAEDLDEARGQALTFIAVVTAATLEMGGSRAMHRVQLEAARKLDELQTQEEIAVTARRYAETVAGKLLEPAQGPSAHLVDRALSILNRNFAKDLTDSIVANELGLSTSHFRYLFREATGQPFHKYLVGLRLERARALLLERDMPVSEVAASVGFSGLAHFSRAFTQRFSVSPTSLRRGTPAST